MRRQTTWAQPFPRTGGVENAGADDSDAAAPVLRVPLMLVHCAGSRHSAAMSKFLRALRVVLWSFIGLGGRRAVADKRMDQIGLLPIIAIAAVLLGLILAGLVALAHFAAQA